MAWIQVECGLREHRKTYALADALGITNSHAAGILVCLWLWATENAQDGSLSSFPARAVALACGWQKKPEVLIGALCDTGWIDKGSNALQIHNWDIRQGFLLDSLDRKKKKTRERVTRYRDKKTASCNVPETVSENVQSVTVTSLPLPNHNLTNISSNKDILEITTSILSPSAKPVKGVYGEFQKVKLSEDEYTKLVQRLGGDKTSRYIERLDGWLAEGHTKKNHYATILNWWRKDNPSATVTADGKEEEGW